MKSDLVDIAVELRHETKAAYLIFDGGTECWLPKSQCEYYKERTAEIVTMPYWLAREKGLI